MTHGKFNGGNKMKITELINYETEKNFLKSAHFVPFTYTAKAANATNGVVKAGTIYPANDATAVGIVFHDTEVGQPMSVIVEGHVYENRLPVVPSETAKTALKNIGFYTEGE